VRSAAAGELPVYEDLFPLGAVSSETCPLHNPNASVLAAYPSSTPRVDSIVQEPSWMSSASSGGSRVVLAARPASSEIVLERVLGSDGVTRMVMRQRP
jgi:hypothetical protein